MYRGFDLRVEDKSIFSYWEPCGREACGGQSQDLLRELEGYTGHQAIDGSRVSDDWFGAVSADVFISHSHGDETTAIGIAGFLKDNFGVSCFIDSLVWGHSEELNRRIDDRYCKFSGGETYDYNKRNYSTSHVHLMLASALAEMIDRCECVIFLNTPASIDAKHSKDRGEEVTASPWIFHELMTTKLIRESRPSRVSLESRALNEAARVRKDAQDQLKIVYKAPLSHLTPLRSSDLFEWINCGYVGLDAMDCLYQMHPRTRE